MKLPTCPLLAWIFIAGLSAAAPAADWPQWGGTNNRNMVSSEKNLPASFSPGEMRDDGTFDTSTAKNIKWIAKLGDKCYGTPVVSGGRVLIGTNNQVPRDPRIKGDRGVLFCLDEATGELRWQLTVPKLPSGKVNDWEYLGIMSSPRIEGDRAWLVTNRCEVLCLDLNGQADGNDGPFTNEAKYLVPRGQKPLTLTAQDADIIWRYDMRDELGSFPHNASNSSPLVIGGRVYVCTSNGVDWTHISIPNPFAPSLIALDKYTGELIGEDTTGISERVFHGQWTSPSAGRIDQQDYVYFGGGDGWCYAFESVPVKGEIEGDEAMVLKEVWRYDCNPPHYRFRDGKRIKYPAEDGPSEVIATPVFYKNRVYVVIGQDPEHLEGLGMLSCIDAIQGGAIWTYDKIKRSISSVAIADGILFAADFTGYLHCLDADTGKVHWTFDSKSHFWSSPLIADGKVYIGNEEGDFYVFAASTEFKLLSTVDLRSPIASTAIAASGVLYVTTDSHLFAVRKK